MAITDQGKLLNWYKSSPEAERGFCSQCGTSLFFRSTNWPGELHIARALVTGEMDRLPAKHSFYDSHVDWMTLADDLADDLVERED